MCRDWKRFKAQIGFTAILHTWNQDLLFHPHLHLVVTAGGLDRTQERWIESKGKFLVPVGALANKVRGKLLHLLKQAGNEGKLALHASIENLQDPVEFAGFISRLYDTRWHIYIKKPFAGPEKVFRYLSRYTHRVAISNQRLLSMTNHRVTFRARDNNNPGMTRTVSVAPEEFIRRLLLHILPKRFVKIRHYGLMAPCNVNTKLETARSLIEKTLPNPAQAPCSAQTPGTETVLVQRELDRCRFSLDSLC
ncbi:transposase [Thermodesulfobacteriota bacterium]